MITVIGGNRPVVEAQSYLFPRAVVEERVEEGFVGAVSADAAKDQEPRKAVRIQRRARRMDQRYSILLTRATQRSQGAITSPKLRTACETGCKRAAAVNNKADRHPLLTGRRLGLEKPAGGGGRAAWPEEMGGEEGIGGRRMEEMGLWLLAVW